MLKFIRSVLDAADPRAQAVGKDLKRLNAVQPGLGDKALAYVLRGENETVLASLASLGGAQRLDVCSRSYTQDDGTVARRRLLAMETPEIDVVLRYTEVLCALCQPLPKAVAGTRHAPDILRVLFTEVFAGLGGRSYPPKLPKASQMGFTPAVAMTVTEKLSGNMADLIDVLYGSDGGDLWYSLTGKYYRQIFDFGSFVADHPDAAVAAGQRLHAKDRATFLHDLHGWQLAERQEFLNFVLDQAGDNSKAAREAALSALKGCSAETIRPGAAKRLEEGNVTMRSGMVDLLAAFAGTDALATLAAHRKGEKAARVAAQIDTILSVAETLSESEAGKECESGYTAIDGSWVEIPALPALATGPAPNFTKDDLALLDSVIAAENARIAEGNEKRKREKYSYKQPLIDGSIGKQAISLFEKLDCEKDRNHLRSFLGYGPGQQWARTALARMPQDRALLLGVWAIGGASRIARLSGQGPFFEVVRDFLSRPNGDFRTLDALDVQLETTVHLGSWQDTISKPAERGDLLRELLRATYFVADPEDYPRDALWPYLASSLEVFDEALGLAPKGRNVFDRRSSVRFLAVLPKTPMRYFAPLLEIATGTAKAGREEARKLLAEAPGVEERLVALLDDPRQEARAGAAQWLADRRSPAAVKALRKRLKKEKSELARAAMLTALSRLGEDLKGYLGPEALTAEAEKGLTKASFDKLDWLGLEHLPAVSFRAGTPVPRDVLRWWIFLAFKLKQPGGNKLFDIYLDQIATDDAERFSRWILESWIAYDTTRPPEEDAIAHARQHAPQHYNFMKRYYKHYTAERSFADLKAQFLSNYPNSGAASKGLLALARRAPAVLAADTVRGYLRNHGARTSQASALMEMLAQMDDPVALQVVIMAATRLKQKSVQKFAGELVEKIAEERNWTLDELADRTIPTAGLDDDGFLDLTCGADGRLYRARLDESLKLVLFNPDGREVSGLPTGQDEVTKASKKQLSTSRKELKQIVAVQSARLYEALCAERTWSREDWHRDFREHPVMRRLTERLVWLGLDNDGNVRHAFRPTAEGDYTDLEDNPVDPGDFAGFRLAHGALVNDGEAWAQHLKDYEIAPLFQQFGRPLLRAQAEQALVEDRKGWVTDAFTIRGVAAKRGYERGEAIDGGFFNEYIKPFRSAGMAAVIEFSGNSLPEENVPAALVSLRFVKHGGRLRSGGDVKLANVPSVLLSECWNDYHDMAAKAAYDPEWESKMPW